VRGATSGGAGGAEVGAIDLNRPLPETERDQ